MKSLPFAKLGSLTSLISSGSTPLGGAARYLSEGPVMFIRSQNVRMNCLDLSDVVYINSALHEEMKRTHVRSGDVFINITGASIGRVAAFDRNAEKANVNQHVCIIRPKSDMLDFRYLTTYLCSPRFQEIINRLQRGGTRQALTFDMIANFDIPLPSLPEQRRIAAILDKADAIRRKRQEAVGEVDSLISSEFHARFGDPVANTQSRKTVPLSAYGRITTGNTPSRKEEDNYGDAIEWIKSDNINTPRHWLTRSTEGLSKKGLAIARTVPPGSTLVTCIAGSPSCVGNAAMADRTVAFNQQINAITPSEHVDPFFLYALVLLSKPLIQRSSTESMKGMVSKGKFEQVEVIEVDPREQTAFGKVLQKILALLDRQYVGDQESDDLFGSLVQRAFRGEL